jgi:hypothetical protein
MKRARYGRKPAYRKYLIALVAIAIIGFGAKAIADNGQPAPSGQAASTPELRNEVRKESLKLIAGAFHRYIAEVGPIPIKISATPAGICSGSTVNCKKYARADMAFLISAGYLNSVPNDPVGGKDLYSTGYLISKDAAGNIVLAAPRAEKGVTISQSMN